MKTNNLNKGSFIIKAILGIVLVLVILGGIYLYTNKKVDAPVIEENNLEILGNKEDLVSFSVKPGETVSGILNLSGSVRNAYFFEGNIGIDLLDANKNLLKQGNGTATSDWMTVEPVSFTATIDSTGLSGKGYIAIREDDPSGGEGGIPSEILIPVVFENDSETSNPETMTVKVYFGDTIDAQSCNTPSYVERVIPKTIAVARASIEELLKGPTEAEKLQDYWTGLRSGIKINSIYIENEVAYLDLLTSGSSSLNDPNKGACGAILTLKQIENTLKQFPTVKNAIITTNGGSVDSINP